MKMIKWCHMTFTEEFLEWCAQQGQIKCTCGRIQEIRPYTREQGERLERVIKGLYRRENAEL